MVKYCAAFGCKERFVKGGLITFHKFPKDETRRKIWENKLRRKDFKATDHTHICSKHFTEDSFDTSKFGGTWLKEDAIPTLFEFSKKPDKPRKKRNFNREENVDKSPEGSTEIVRQPTRKIRYVGDFTEEDMDSPTKARKFFKIALTVVEKKDMQLKNLKKENKKLEKRVASLEQILDEIKKDYMQLKDLKEKNKKLEKRLASSEPILDEIKKETDAASDIL